MNFYKIRYKNQPKRLKTPCFYLYCKKNLGKENYHYLDAYYQYMRKEITEEEYEEEFSFASLFRSWHKL